MLDFSNLQEIMLPTVKKVKLDLFNSFNEDTMTTMMKKQEEQLIPFLSLRQKYGIQFHGGQYPLPLKYAVLIELAKNLEMNYWRNQRQIQFTIDNNIAEIVQVCQLLSIEPSFYKIKVIKNGIVIQHPFYKKITICKYQENSTQIPNEIQVRIDLIRCKLDKLVKLRHQEFLSQNNLQNFESFGIRNQVYHNDFDVNDSADIIPIKQKHQIFSQELITIHTEVLNQIVEYYEKRHVSFVFQDNLLTHLSIHFNKSRKDIERIVTNLCKIIPDQIKLINNHINQSKWMIQIDRTSLSNNSSLMTQYLCI